MSTVYITFSGFAPAAPAAPNYRYLGLASDGNYLWATKYDNGTLALKQVDLSATALSLVETDTLGTVSLSDVPGTYDIQPKTTPRSGEVWVYGRTGDDDQAVYYSDFGTTPSGTLSQTGRVVRSLHWNPFDPDDLIAVYGSRQVDRTTDNGGTWTEEGTATPGTVVAGIRNPTQPYIIMVAGGSAGDSDISINYGEDWQDTSDGSMGTINSFFAMW